MIYLDLQSNPALAYRNFTELIYSSRDAGREPIDSVGILEDKQSNLR